MTAAVSDASGSAPLVALRDLQVHYPAGGGWGRPRRWQRAVDGVDLTLWSGETLGLVGESGCGKSTLGRAVVGLQAPTAGQVELLGQNLQGLSAAALKALRRQVQIVFQDPQAALNPRETVGRAVQAGLDIHGLGTPAQRRQQVAQWFERVGLSPSLVNRWPHEFSGGQRQRIVIARALALQPQVLVCDEPVSALDVSIQAQVLNLLKRLQAEMGLSLLFVSHNLAVVEHMADRVAVMYRGRIVELASRDQLFATPRHPYTQALLAAVPTPDPRRRGLPLLRGEAAAPVVQQGAAGPSTATGCRFAARCPAVHSRCHQAEPGLLTPVPGHQVACWLAAA